MTAVHKTKLKTDRARFDQIRAAYFAFADETGVEMADIYGPHIYTFTAEEAIELGHKLVHAGTEALRAETKRTEEAL